jgi:hypothetical protein
MSIGYRPKGADGPLYHPERDYAYITPTLMRTAIERLDAQDLPEEIKQWKQDNNITEDEIVAAAEALARAQRDFVNAADPVESFEQALARRDFYDLRLPVRQFLFAMIGKVFCAAWFVAVREVTKVGAVPPSEREMADFTAAVHKFATNAGVGKSCSDLATLQLRNDVLQARINILGAECNKLRQELAKAQTPIPIPLPSPSVWAKILKPVSRLLEDLGHVK